jgi:hypothetical protein
VVLAFIAAALLALGAAFQIGLALGAPRGAAAYGGRAAADGTLPRRWRLVSARSVLALLAAIWAVLAAAVVDRGPVASSVLTTVLWGMAALFALSALANALARHPGERWVAGSAAALLAVLCALIAQG